MPSKGTRITPLRLSDELLDRIHASIASNNGRRREEEYNLTSWIRQAIEERLAKLERSRKGGKRKNAPAAVHCAAQQPAEEEELVQAVIDETTGEIMFDVSPKLHDAPPVEQYPAE